MKQVTVYTTPTCSFCRAAKAFFAEKKVPYSEIDVSADPAKAQEMVNKSGQLGVPVFEIDGQIVVGFDRATVTRLIGI